MSLKVRRIIFYILLLFFIAGSVVAIFYVQGYRLDFNTFSFQETGGIFIRSIPSDARIHVNGEEVDNKSSLIQSGTFISGLVPDMYSIEVFKDGFQSWIKNLVVDPSSVAEASRVFLLPSELNFSLIQDGVDDMWVRGKVVVTKTAKQKLSLVDWSADRQSGIFKDDATDTYFIKKIEDSNSALNLNLLFNNLKERKLGLPGAVKVISVKAHPFDTSRVFIASRGALYAVDTARLSIELVTTSTISDFAVGSDKIYWADPDGIWSYNLIVRTTSKIGDSDAGIKNITLSSSGAYIAAIFNNGALYIIPTNGETKFKIADFAVDAHFASDDKKVAYQDVNGRFYIYFLDDFLSDIRKRKGEMIDIETVYETSSHFEWYNDAFHFFVQNRGNLSFSEIDDRAPRNTYTVKEKISKYIYDGSTQLLYILEDGKLSRMEFKF